MVAPATKADVEKLAAEVRTLRTDQLHREIMTYLFVLTLGVVGLAALTLG